jgi:FixJ family two-component response regulator
MRVARNRKVILVVDDDEDVRELTVGLLSSRGYKVRSACNGKEGMDELRTDPSIGLLLTDIVMPGPVDGWQLAHEAKKLRPNLRILYMSGFPREIPFAEKGMGYGPLLQKPWHSRQLFEHVQKALA